MANPKAFLAGKPGCAGVTPGPAAPTPQASTPTVTPLYPATGFIKPSKSNEPNGFVHQSENIVTTPDPTDEQYKLSTAFLPNILDSYDSYTYHFKLFIVPPSVSRSGKVFEPNDQIIIAESGVSDLTIDKVKIDTIATPTLRSGTGTMTNLSFEIVEPAGAGLIDKIFYQSIALGVGNWNVMPFYVQLEFRSREPDTSEVANSAPGSLSTLKWIWPVRLTDIKANVTHVGTIYQFDSIIYNELAQGNAYGTLQHATTLENLTNFGDAMKKLETKINEDQIFRLIGGVSIPNQYKIIVDPELAGYEITPSDNNTNTVRNNSFSADGKSATFLQSTGIDKIIDSLLSQTEKAQKGLLGSKGPAWEGGAPMAQETSQMKEFWRIVTETRPLGFDVTQLNLAYEFRIYIIKYDIGVLDNNAFQDSAGQVTASAEKKRIETYLRKQILRKKYNYIFTGLNDQILNFDLQLNNAFAVAQSRMSGIYQELAMVDKGPVNQNNAERERGVKEKVSQTISLLNTAPNSTVETEAAVAETIKAVEASTLSEAEKQRNIRILQQYKPESRLNYLQSVTDAGGLNTDGQLSRLKINATKLATPTSENQASRSRFFISDVDPFGENSKTAYKEYAKYAKGKLRPVARLDTPQWRAVGMGMDQNSNSGLQQLTSMFAVALHSGLDASFAEINMTIKGDPFWLFPPPIAESDTQLYTNLDNPAEAIKSIKRSHFRNEYAANLYGTDNFLLIRFRSPRIFNVDENPDSNNPFSDVETFSAIYKVITVTTTFEKGKFVQELYCQMDYNVNVLDFFRQIEEENAKAETPTSPDDLINRVRVPDGITKSPRIMGSVDIPGVATGTNVAGVVKKGTDLAGNLPTSVPNVVPGLPGTFG
jgi:hypothetical protein